MEKPNQILVDFMSFLPLALLFSYFSHRISHRKIKHLRYHIHTCFGTNLAKLSAQAYRDVSHSVRA